MWSLIIVVTAIALATYQGLRFVSRSGDHINQELKQELLEFSKNQKTIVYFLRHGGCIFCYEGLHDFKHFLAELKDPLPFVVVVLLDDVHVETIRQDLAPLCKAGLRVIVDDGGLYRSFGLPRGRFLDLFSPATCIAGFRAMQKIPSYRIKKPLSDGFQMGGFFVLNSGEILRSFLGKHAGDQQFFVD